MAAWTRTALALALVCSFGVARADTRPSDPAAAEALFTEAKALMDQHRYEEACPKLEASMRLDPGTGTLLNLALCHEQLGKTATAWTEYNLALSQAIKDGRLDRQDIAHERISALAPLLAHVSIDVETSAPNDMTITVDDEPLAREAWRTEVPSDPGDHRVDVHANGRTSWHRTIHVETSQTVHVAVPQLAVENAASATPHEPSAPRESQSPPSVGRRTASFILMGAGIASIGVGAGFGVATLSNRDEANRLCPGTAPCPSSAGLDASDRAHAYAWGADIGVGVGVVAIAIGTYLLLTSQGASPAPARPAASFASPSTIFF